MSFVMVGLSWLWWAHLFVGGLREMVGEIFFCSVWKREQESMWKGLRRYCVYRTFREKYCVAILSDLLLNVEIPIVEENSGEVVLVFGFFICGGCGAVFFDT